MSNLILDLNTFKRFDIPLNGEIFPIPNDIALIEILSKDLSLKSQLLIRERSNNLIERVNSNPHRYLEDTHFYEYQKLSEHAGHSIPYIYCFVQIIEYYNFLLENTIISGNKLRTKYMELRDHFSQENIAGKIFDHSNLYKESKIIQKYPYLREINSKLEVILNELKYLAVYNMEVKKIFQQMYKKEVKSIDRLSKEKKNILTELAFCPYCDELFEFSRGQGVGEALHHCGQLECERAYGRERKRKNDKRKSLKKRAAELGWETDDLNQKRCNSCRKRKQVNENNLCRECFVDQKLNPQ